MAHNHICCCVTLSHNNILYIVQDLIFVVDELAGVTHDICPDVQYFIVYPQRVNGIIVYICIFRNQRRSEVESMTMASLHSEALQQSSFKFTLLLSRDNGVIISSNYQGKRGMHHDANGIIYWNCCFCTFAELYLSLQRHTADAN
jgi:hypothetical protein